MKRRDFFKGLLGLALLPFVPKVEAKSKYTFPEYAIYPNDLISIDHSSVAVGSNKTVGALDGVYKVTHITCTPPLHKTDKGIWMLDHWCKGHYEAVPLYPGDHLGPQSAKWVCTCTAYELMSQFIKQERDQQIINAIRG